jgi:hypothetical protein
MARQPAPTPLTARDWSAKDIDELRAVWNDLRPDSDDPATERHFFGQLLTAELAGDVFERWLMEAFRLSGATGTYAFQVPLLGSGTTREEIDGLILDGSRGYLVEVKFWTGKVDFGPIALLHTLLDLRPVGTMGLFFSAFGYTEPALESATLLRPQRVLLFYRDDLMWALPPANLGKAKAAKAFQGRMLEMVRRKWLLAIRSAVPNLPLALDIDLFNQLEV